MLKNPSIHIRRSDLIKILDALGIDHTIAEKIMYDARNHNIQNRVSVTLSSRAKKKAERSAGTDNTKIVEEFNRVFDAYNKDNNIKMLVIHKTDPQYITLKEVANQAVSFCNLYSIESLETGFKAYLDIALHLLKSKYSIYRLKSYGQRITEYYGAIDTIKKDTDPKRTEFMYLAWRKAVVKYFGHNLEITDPQKYMYFVMAREDADQMNASYEDWMCAQFEKWSFLNSIPEFSQYTGEQAAINYSVYVKKENKEYSSKEEKNYFNKLKDEKEIPLKSNQRQKKKS
jgi:hypothetical protein